MTRTSLLIIVFAIVSFTAAILIRVRLASPVTLPTPTLTANAEWSPFPSGYSDKVRKITVWLDNAPTSQPSATDAAELFEDVLHDSDFHIRVRAMAVFPFLAEREKAIDVLISALHDHDPRTNGGGNVPLYATTYLADMAATRAIPDIADWVDFLAKNPPYNNGMRAAVLQKSTADLNRLRQAAATQPTS